MEILFGVIIGLGILALGGYLIFKDGEGGSPQVGPGGGYRPINGDKDPAGPEKQR